MKLVIGAAMVVVGFGIQFYVIRKQNKDNERRVDELIDRYIK